MVAAGEAVAVANGLAVADGDAMAGVVIVAAGDDNGVLSLFTS